MESYLGNVLTTIPFCILISPSTHLLWELEAFNDLWSDLIGSLHNCVAGSLVSRQNQMS